MKYAVITTLAVALGIFTAQAAVYTDTIDAGGGDMDITQVEVTHDAANINFVLTLDGTSIGLDTSKHIGVAFDTVAGGDTGANAWDYQPYMSAGMDYFSAGWTDGADYLQLNTYSEALGGWPEWDNGANDTWAEWTEPAIAGNTISFSVSRAVLGVTGAADSFDFDVYTFWSGGTWTADGLGATVGGSGSYNSTVNGINTYAIPEPATFVLMLMSGGGLVAFRRYLKR